VYSRLHFIANMYTSQENDTSDFAAVILDSTHPAKLFSIAVSSSSKLDTQNIGLPLTFVTDNYSV